MGRNAPVDGQICGYVHRASGRIAQPCHQLVYWTRHPIDALCSIGYGLEYVVRGYDVDDFGEVYEIGEWYEVFGRGTRVGRFFHRHLGRRYFAWRDRRRPRQYFAWGGNAWRLPILPAGVDDDIPF